MRLSPNISRFLFCLINSGYSFWWDVVKDWDLTLFSAQRHDKDHPYGLRRHRFFHSDRLYHYVIIADLVLRFSWLWRILPGLSWLPETECGLFLLMFLEVARRWVWVFFRTEAEWSMSTATQVLSRTDFDEILFANNMVIQSGIPTDLVQTMSYLASTTTNSTRINQVNSSFRLSLPLLGMSMRRGI